MSVSKATAFNVYRNSRLVDTVWFTGYTAEEARRSLIDHDGYAPDIVVTEGMLRTPVNFYGEDRDV